MKRKYIEASELPENEKVYLRKDWLGWKQIHPNRGPDGNIILVNLLYGGWRNLLTLLFILAVILTHFHEDKLNLQAAQDNCQGIYKDPNGFCKAVCQKDTQRLKDVYLLNISLSGIRDVKEEG